MSTYAQPISIYWGAGTAPTTVRVIDSTGAAQTPTLTTAIAETPASSGVYTAVATFDTSWGLAKDYWTNGDGNYYPGDGPQAVNVMRVNGSDLTVLSTVEGLVVYNRSPVKPDHIDVFRKDSYKSSEGSGRTLSFTWDGSEPWPDTLTTAHFSCTPTTATLEDYPTAVGLTDVALTVDTATGSSRKVTLALTATQTGTLQAGLTGTAGYRFWIVANKDTEPATLRSGTMTVRPDPTA